jgi:hypothetical protein
MLDPQIIGRQVPWNAAWTAEERYEVRFCRYAQRPALWMPHAPGQGRPVFAKPHMGRQRESVIRKLCTVCGERTPAGDRWWFGLGVRQDGYFMTTETAVHKRCGQHALKVCPHLKTKGRDLTPMPEPDTVLTALIGGPFVERDFGLKITESDGVAGHLKLAWHLRLADTNGRLTLPKLVPTGGSKPTFARSRFF